MKFQLLVKPQKFNLLFLITSFRKVLMGVSEFDNLVSSTLPLYVRYVRVSPIGNIPALGVLA